MGGASSAADVSMPSGISELNVSRNASKCSSTLAANRSSAPAWGCVAMAEGGAGKRPKGREDEGGILCNVRPSVHRCRAWARVGH